MAMNALLFGCIIVLLMTLTCIHFDFWTGYQYLNRRVQVHKTLKDVVKG